MNNEIVRSKKSFQQVRYDNNPKTHCFILKTNFFHFKTKLLFNQSLEKSNEFIIISFFDDNWFKISMIVLECHVLKF